MFRHARRFMCSVATTTTAVSKPKRQRYKAIIEYSGHAFSGFQKQPHTPLTVQGVIERAASYLNEPRDRPAPVDVVAAGRTDAGVHALGQCIHFDLRRTTPIAVTNILKSINARVGDIRNEAVSTHRAAAAAGATGTGTGTKPASVIGMEASDAAAATIESDTPLLRVISVEAVTDAFHARYCASGRTYGYQLIAPLATLPQPAKRGPTSWDNRSWRLDRSIDVDRMRTAAQSFLGTHNFGAFRSVGCTVCHAAVMMVSTTHVVTPNDSLARCIV